MNTTGSTLETVDGAYTLVTPPSVEPVDGHELAEHLRIPGDHFVSEGQYLSDLATAARYHVEHAELWRQLITATWKATFPGFPRGRIYLRYPPLQEVTAVEYLDADGETQTVSADDYLVATDYQPGFVAPLPGKSWPGGAARRPDAVTVTFKAGYGDSGADVPAGIRLAIRQIAGSWYENREAVVVGTIVNRLPMGVDYILRAHSIKGVV